MSAIASSSTSTSSSLKPDARATLDRQAGWLGKYPQVNVQVAGNCDERGTEEYNLALGQRRANASRDYLVARASRARGSRTISYGKDRPTALGDERAGLGAEPQHDHLGPLIAAARSPAHCNRRPRAAGLFAWCDMPRLALTA